MTQHRCRHCKTPLRRAVLSGCCSACRKTRICMICHGAKPPVPGKWCQGCLGISRAIREALDLPVRRAE